MEERAKQRAERKAILDEKKKRQDEEKLVRSFISNAIIWFYRSLCTIHSFEVLLFAERRERPRVQSPLLEKQLWSLSLHAGYLVHFSRFKTSSTNSCCLFIWQIFRNIIEQSGVPKIITGGGKSFSNACQCNRI